MILVLISPEADDPRERAVLAALMAAEAGPERYHLRKPNWSAAKTEAWLREFPVEWRRRVVLHGPPELARRFGLWGAHAKDGMAGAGRFRSTSRHEWWALQEAIGRFDSVFFGPVFASISKRGYGREVRADEAELGEFLQARRRDLGGAGAGGADPERGGRRTQVIAVGGVTASRLERCAELGFDGGAGSGLGGVGSGGGVERDRRRRGETRKGAPCRLRPPPAFP
jgi:thiamine-phosphate pyrophosphorylase